MRNAGAIALAVLLAALAAWWLLDAGPGTPDADDPYSASDDEGNGPGLEGREVDGAGPRAGDPGGTDADPEAPDEDAEGITLIGRVVDEARRPMAGARVISQFADRPEHETRTDDEGRFALQVGDRPGKFVVGTLRAFAEDGRVGAGPVGIQPTTPDKLPMNPIVVGTVFTLDVRVQYAGVPQAGVPVVVAQKIWARMTPIAKGKTNAEGVFRARHLPRGPVRVFAAAPERGRNHIGVSLPRSEPGPVVLELLEERPITVTVVDKATRTPVEGARVNVGDRYSAWTGSGLWLLPPVEVPPTDARGQTVVPTLNGRDEYFVNAEAEGYAPPNPMVGRAATVPEQTDTVTCELFAFRSMSFAIRGGEVAVPQDGTPLELQVLAWMKPYFDEGAAARIEGGRLIIEGLPAPWVNGRVVTPEGAFAVFKAPVNQVEGPDVSFQRGLEARVRIVERGGGPLEGARLTWRGGFAFGKQGISVTNAKGEARLTGMSGGKLQVVLLAPGETWAGIIAGEIALDPGNMDEIHVLEVEPTSRLTLNVTLAGEPGLPPEYQLRVGNRFIAPGEIEEDPATGVLALSLRLPAGDQPLPIQLRARGYTAAGATVRPGTDAVTLELQPAARLTVHLTPPEDGDFSLAVERYDDEGERWVPARAQRADGDPSLGSSGRQEASTRAFIVAETGRFRVRDVHSDTYSAPVDLALGYDAEVGLDLSRNVWIQVEVEAPGGTNLSRTRLFRTDVAPAHRQGRQVGLPVDGRGRGRVRVVRGERVTLSVRHPVLAAAAEGGIVNAVGGRGGRVVLRLEAGNTVVFRLPPAGEGRQNRAARVVLAPAGDFASGDVFEAMTILADGVHRVGGFAPGRYTIWIDAFRGGPIVLPSRQLGSGANDLGLLTPSKGATLRVKVTAPTGEKTPLVWAVARREGVPSFSRTATRAEGSREDVLVTGLAAGTYEVSLRRRGGSRVPVPAPQTVEVGEAGEAEVTFDLK